MVRALLFDLDGTLARYEGDFVRGWTDALRDDLGLPAAAREAFATALLPELGRDGPLTLRSALGRALAALGEDPGPEGTEPALARALARYAADVRPVPGAAALLAELAERGVPLALVTNGPDDMQRAALARTGLARHLRAVIVSGDRDVGARKPAARPFALALTGLEATPTEAVMIGDDLAKDVQGALAYGLGAVRMGGPGGDGYDGVADLAELRAWLAGRLAVPGAG